MSAGCFVDRSGFDPAADGNPRTGCSVDCENGGVCVGDQCFCGSVDYAGAACEARIDDCEGIDCGEGTCVDGVRDHACDCAENWTLDGNERCTVYVASCTTPDACIEGTCDDTSGSVVCNCDPGFVGNNCAVPINCGSPPNPPANAAGGAVNGTLFGAVAVYGCLSGFGPGSDGVRCQEDATWEPLTLTCARNGCGLPDEIDHGSVSLSDGLNPQSVASYACDAPYVLDGEAERTCGTGGSWSGEAPACRLEGTCTPDPCVAGACVEHGVDLFECECQSGFTDPYCGSDIDECAGGFGPCYVFGASSCLNQIGGYFCNCRTGWSGQNCDVQDP